MNLLHVSRCLKTATLLLVGTGALTSAAPALAQSDKAEITVLYDAFGKSSTMKKDWGFSAFIEYGGKRILFDTGNNAEIFAHNVQAKGIDLTDLDFAVVSHRHGDHTSGLNHLMTVNPDVPIYVPKENFGVFGAALPGTFYKRDEPWRTTCRVRRHTSTCTWSARSRSHADGIAAAVAGIKIESFGPFRGTTAEVAARRAALRSG